MHNQEKNLVKRIKKGQQHAFRELYELHVDYALRTAYGIVRNKSDAADIVQETFIRIYKSIHQFDVKKPFKPWFYQILVNESRRFLIKRSKAGISTSSEQLLDYLHQSQNEGRNYDSLEIAMENVPDNTRALLILKYLNGFTEKEIATILDLNQSTVKSRLYKARNELRVSLKEANHEE